MPVSAQLHARPIYHRPPFRQGIPGVYSRGLVDPRVCLTVPGIESRIVQPITQPLYRLRHPRSTFLSYCL